jgi:penicillin-binding protein 2
VNFARRLAVLAMAFVVLFSLLFTRLWFVQVASGTLYEEEASRQQLDAERTTAARGEIRDSGGILLATSRIVPELIVHRSEIAPEDEEALIQQLGALFNLPTIEVRALFEQAGPVVEFSMGIVTPEQMSYVLKNTEDFPGIAVQDRPIRVYPEGSLFSHVIGHIGRPSPDDVAAAGPDLDPTGTIGKFGVEKFYDDYLQGERGTLLYRVDPQGDPLGLEEELPAVQGNTVHLTLDSELQRQVEFAVHEAMDLSRELEEGDPDLAAAVVLDIADGSVLAMYSYPDFEPGRFVEGMSQSEYSALEEQKAFTNLVIQGAYPPGSTFKAITWAAAINEELYPRGLTTAAGTIDCEGELDLGVEENEGGQLAFTDAGHGTTDLHTALGKSCNVYFWQVALTIWREYKDDPDEEDILQRWARRLSLDEPTGVDLPFENGGRIPDRQLYEGWAESPRGSLLLAPDRFTEALWRGGDVMGIAIGQGDVLATPLQMAVAFAALVNGGEVLEPHVVDRVTSVDGRLVLDVGKTVTRRIEFTEEHERFVREDFTRVTNAGGTAAAAFSVMQNPWQTGGKTGTAERDASEYDTAWFVGVTPIDNPRYVVAVMIVDGGVAGKVAAPAVRNIMQYLLPSEPVTPVRPGGASRPAINSATEEDDS